MDIWKYGYSSTPSFIWYCTEGNSCCTNNQNQQAVEISSHTNSVFNHFVTASYALCAIFLILLFKRDKWKTSNQSVLHLFPTCVFLCSLPKCVPSQHNQTPSSRGRLSFVLSPWMGKMICYGSQSWKSNIFTLTFLYIALSLEYLHYVLSHAVYDTWGVTVYDSTLKKRGNTPAVDSRGIHISVFV